MTLLRKLTRWRHAAAALLISAAGVFGLRATASAAACVSNGSGNWGTAATWTNCGGVVPQPTDSVYIRGGHAVTLNVSSSVLRVEMRGGSLVADSNNRVLTLTPIASTSAFMVTASTQFTPSNSTIVISTRATPITVNVGTVTFNNLIINSTVTAAVTYNFGSSSITCLGDLTIQPHKATATNVTVSLNMAAPIVVVGTTTLRTSNTALPSLTTTASNRALTTGWLSIGTSATLTANAAQITLTGNSGVLFTRLGTFTQGTSTVTFNGDGTAILNNNATITFNHLVLAPTLTADRTYSFGTSAPTINGNFTINPIKSTAGNQTLTVRLGAATSVAATGTIYSSGTTNAYSNLDTTSSNWALTAGRLNIGANGTVTANNSIITLNAAAGPLISETGSFVQGGSTVAFTANAAINPVTAGSITFNHLLFSPTITVARTYTLGSGAIAVNGNLTLNPTAATALGLTVNMGSALVCIGTTTITGTTLGRSELTTTASNFDFTTGRLNIVTNSTFTANASQITLNSATGPLFTRTGAFASGTSTVTISPPASVVVNTSSMTVRHLVIASPGFTQTFGSSVTVQGNFTLQDGWLDDGGFSFAGTAAGKFAMNANTKLLLGSNSAGTTFPANFTNANISLTAGTTVAYDANVAQTISGTPTYANLELTSTTGSQTKTAAAAVTVTEDLTIGANNTYSVSGSNFGLTIGGNYTNNGTFSAGNSTVTFNATAPGNTLSGNLSGPSQFGFLTFNGSGGEWSATSSMTVTGNFTVTAGTFTTADDVLVNGDVVGNGASGNINMTAGTFTQRVAGNELFGTNIAGGNNWVFNDLTFTNSSAADRTITINSGGTGYVIVNGTMSVGAVTDTNRTIIDNTTGNRVFDVNGDVLITTDGTLQASSSALFTVGGNWTNNGLFTANSSTVTFDSSSDQTLAGTLSGPAQFNHVVFNGDGGSWTNTSSMSVAGNLAMLKGTMYGTNDVLVNGNVSGDGSNGSFNFTGGTFTHRVASNQIFGSTSTGSAAWTFNNLTLSNSAAADRTISLASSGGGDITINRLLTIGSAADTNITLLDNSTANRNVDISSVNITTRGSFTPSASVPLEISGNWTNNGIFTANSSSVTFISTGTQVLAGRTTFYNLVAITAGTTLQFTAGTTHYITNKLTFDNVNLKSSLTNATWYIRLSGPSQQILDVDVRDSNASLGSNLNALGNSRNLGNNTNWTFTVTDVGNRYWVGASAGIWTNTANWAITSGGTPGAQVPLSTHTVIFDGAAGGACNINTDVTVYAMEIEGYSGSVNTQSRGLTVTDHFSQTSGTVNLGTSVVTMQGSLIRTSGNFSAGTSTINFTGSSNALLNPGATGFYHVSINKPSGGLTLSGALDVNGNFSLLAGTLTTGGFSMSMARDWTRTGGFFDADSNIVTFDGAGASALSGSTTFYGLRNITGASTLRFAAGTTFYVTDMIEFRNNSLASSANNATWYFTFTGSSQTLSNVTVRDSNATGGNTLIAGISSTDQGNNRNWIFGDGSLRYWVANTASNWNDTASWSYSSNGIPGAPIPTSDQTVIFDGAGGNNGNALIDSAVVISTLTISGYTGTLDSQNFDITVSSAFTQTTGTVQLGASMLTLSGDFVRSGGNFSADTSTVAFTGTQNQTLTSNATGFFNMLINKAAGTLTMTDNLTVSGNWTIASGTFDAGTSTVTFDATAARTIDNAQQQFGHVVFDGSGGTWTLQDPLRTTGSLTLINGTLDTSASNHLIEVANNATLTGGALTLRRSTMSVEGNWDQTGTTLNVGASTVAFTGALAQSIDAGGAIFFNVEINKPSGTATLAAPLLSTGTLTITAGTLDTGADWNVAVTSDIVVNGGTFNLNNSPITVQRNWNVSSGVINPGASTVTFNGGFSQNITSSGDSFFHVVINKPAGSMTLLDALDIDGNFTLTTGTFVANGQAITAGGNWTRTAGLFTGANSTVTFNSPTANVLSGFTTFYTLRAVTPNTTLYFTAGTTQYVSNMLDLSDVSLLSTANNTSWYLALTGTGQSVSNVAVRDSNAIGGRTLIANGGSVDLGNNRNWAFGDKRFWISSVASTWNTAANWSRTSGGTGGASVPTSTHTVIFDSQRNGQCNVNVAVNIASLTISGYTGLLNTQGYNITVSSALTQTSGTITLTTNTVTIGGDFIRGGGTFNASGSTITLTGTQDQTINTRSAALFTLTVNKSGGVARLGQHLTLNGSLQLDNGTFDTSASNFALTVTSNVILNGGTFNLNNSTMSVARNWTKNSGAFSAGASTVNFIGGNTQTLTSGGTDFYHLVVNKTAATILNVSGTLGIDGDMNNTQGTFTTQNNLVNIAGNTVLTAGIWNLGTSSVTIGGNFSRGILTFNANASTVAFTGGSNQVILSSGVSFFNVEINKSANTATLGSAFTATGNLTVNNGTLDTSGSNWSVTVTSHVRIDGGTFNLNASTMSLQRDWVVTLGAFNSGTSTVTFTGSNTQNITSNGSAFTNLTINKAAGSLVLQDALDINGIFTHTLGTFNTNARAIEAGGNWTRAAAPLFTGTGSTVTFNSPTVQTLAGPTTFYAMRAVTPNATLYFTAGSTQYVTGLVDFENIALRSTTNNATWYFSYTGSSQTLIGITVQDSNANTGSALLADDTNTDAGNNRNWIFGSSNTRYWAATATANWNTPTSWAYSSGGGAGAPVPTATDIVVFDGVAGRNGQANVNMTVNIASLTISGYSGIVNTLGYDITVSSSLTQTSGTITLTTNTVTVGGDFLRTAGTLTVANSTITLNGAGDQILNSGGAALNHLYINKSDGVARLGQHHTLNGQLIIANGVLDTSPSNYALTVSSYVEIRGGELDLNASTMSVARNWTKTGGAFSAGTSTVNFLGGNTQTLTAGGTDFYHLVVNKTAATILNVNGALGIDGMMTNTQGTFTTQNNAVNIAGSAVLTAGIWNLGTSSVTIGGDFSRGTLTFNAGASTVAFTGGSNQVILSSGVSFFNVVVDKSANTATLSSALTATGSLSVNSGTLDTSGSNWSVTITSHVNVAGGTFNLNGSTLSLQRDWIFSSGAFNAGTSTVTFTGSNTQNLLSNGSSFRHLTINKAGGSVVLQDNLDMGGHFTNTLGTFNTGFDAISVGGDWRWTAGTYTGTGSTVTFNSPTSQTLSGSTTFYAMRAITPNTTLYFTAGTTQYATNMIDLENLSLRSTTNNATWYFTVNASALNQTLLDVDVRDSNASFGSTLFPDALSTDSGNNRNWAFGGINRRYWVRSVASSWNSATSWSYTSGGTAGAPIPASTDTVVFDGAGGYNGQANINVAVNIASLTVSGFSGTLNTQGFNITVSSGLTQTSGTVTLTTNTVSVGGDFVRTGGTFNSAASTLTFTGALAQTFDPGNATLFNVHVNKTGGNVTLTEALNANGNLTLSAGTLDTGAGNWSVTVASHVVMTGGTFDLNNSTMSVQRDWLITSATLVPGGSTVTFTGSNTQNLTSGGDSFFNVTINKAAGSVVLQDAFDADGIFTNTLGTFNTTGKAVTVGRDWRWTAGTFTGTGSTVTFNPTTVATLSGSTTFYALRAITPNTTLYFTAGTTQYVTGLVDFEDISLRSTTNNATWYFTYTGSSQTLIDIGVRDSNASYGSTMITNLGSTDDGNNRNWSFGGIPNAITNLTAVPSATGGAIDLTWNAPGENGASGTLFNSTFTIQYTTDTVFAVSNSWSSSAAQPSHVFRVDIATTNVAAGSAAASTISNLTGNSTYYFRAWTKDATGLTSAISNGATNYATVINLGVSLSTTSIQFGSLPAGTTNVISSSITVTNTGNVTQKFMIYIDTPAVWAPTANAAGVDTFRLTGVFKNTLPVSADFDFSNDVITASTATATTSILARDADADSEKGFNVLPGTSRGLWFRIEIPPVSSTTTEQTITLHATASQ